MMMQMVASFAEFERAMADSCGNSVSRDPMRKRPFVKAGKPAGNGLLLGYARVSKGDDQTHTLQARALRAAGCRRIFEEAASGGRWDRPELHRMLDQLRAGDTIVVWKLDRLSRSLKDVLHIMERIAQAGAGFQSITENPKAARDLYAFHVPVFRKVRKERLHRATVRRLATAFGAL